MGAHTLAEQADILPKSPLVDIAEVSPKADTTVEEQQMNDARQEAAQFGRSTTGEEDPKFVALEESFKQQDAVADEQRNSLEAAVRCGVIRGFE